MKRWKRGELEELTPVLDAILDRDPERVVESSIAAGFLAPNHGFDPNFVYEYVSSPYEPFLVERFTYTRAWVAEALQRVVDIQGRYGELIRVLNVPASYVILDRVVWGVSALLGRLEATNTWRALLAEYRKGAPPCTELGEREAEWRGAVASRAG